jgi:hypothetical protein
MRRCGWLIITGPAIPGVEQLSAYDERFVSGPAEIVWLLSRAGVRREQIRLVSPPFGNQLRFYPPDYGPCRSMGELHALCNWTFDPLKCLDELIQIAESMDCAYLVWILKDHARPEEPRADSFIELFNFHLDRAGLGKFGAAVSKKFEGSIGWITSCGSRDVPSDFFKDLPNVGAVTSSPGSALASRICVIDGEAVRSLADGFDRALIAAWLRGSFAKVRLSEAPSIMRKLQPVACEEIERFGCYDPEMGEFFPIPEGAEALCPAAFEDGPLCDEIELGSIHAGIDFRRFEQIRADLAGDALCEAGRLLQHIGRSRTPREKSLAHALQAEVLPYLNDLIEQIPPARLPSLAVFEPPPPPRMGLLPPARPPCGQVVTAPRRDVGPDEIASSSGRLVAQLRRLMDETGLRSVRVHGGGEAFLRELTDAELNEARRGSTSPLTFSESGSPSDDEDDGSPLDANPDHFAIAMRALRKVAEATREGILQVSRRESEELRSKLVDLVGEPPNSFYEGGPEMSALLAGARRSLTLAGESEDGAMELAKWCLHRACFEEQQAARRRASAETGARGDDGDEAQIECRSE